MKKVLLFTTVLALVVINCSGQIYYVGNIAYKTGKLNTIEIGGVISFAKRICRGHYPHLIGPYISSGIGLNGQKPFVVPKVGFEIMPMCFDRSISGISGIKFGGRICYINYTDFHTSQQCVLPEIGLAIPFFNVYYGYNFNLTTEDFTSEKHVVTFSIWFPIFFKEKRKKDPKPKQVKDKKESKAMPRIR